MPASTRDEDLAQAVLQNVQKNAYPDSDHVISADLPPSAITSLLSGLSKAREEVKSEIRTLSGEAAPDIDGWITQAKQLQVDIERSKTTAQEIVKEAEAAQELRTRVQDAASKVSLLENELVFNESLTETVRHIQSIIGTLKQARDAAEQDRILIALQRLQDADESMTRLKGMENTRVLGVVQRQIDQLRSAIVESLHTSWKALIVVDPTEKFMSIKKDIKRQATITIDSVVEAMSSLSLLDNAIDRLSTDMDHIVFAPRLLHDANNHPSTIAIKDNDITVTGQKPNPTVSNTLADVSLIVEYLNARFPSTISHPLSEKLLPLVTSRLVTGWLEQSIPVSLDDISAFQGTVSHVQGLVQRLQAIEWRGWDQLAAWVDSIPSLWLSKRKEVALSGVRRLCKTGSTNTRPVERVETQMVSNQDALVAPTAQPDDDDWGAEWGDEENQKSSGDPPPQSPVAAKQDQGDEEDANAWGWDEEDNEEKEDKHQEAAKDTAEKEEEEEEEWGAWGDDDDKPSKADTAPSRPTAPTLSPQLNGKQFHSGAEEREVTLRETYTVTAIPDALIETISQIVSDVSRLHETSFEDSSIAPAAVGLYMLPPLILSMYRAVAGNYYTADAGNMLIYNDCTRLADQLRIYLAEQAESEHMSELPLAARPSTQLHLENEIKAIEGFGKRAYGREMESQRTIIRDLLDGAQGFANCTQQPFARECDNAVSITVDRIREVNKQWQSVLSHSARLQSLGSLLSTITSKVIMDIEDMGDISEEESQRLRHYCQEIAKIGDVFKQEGESGTQDEQRELTGIYTPNWLKFQYLSEILDGSLADIKFLWTESELKFEFEADEVIDLIKALFSESDHRRRAVAEIRNSAR